MFQFSFSNNVLIRETLLKSVILCYTAMAVWDRMLKLYLPVMMSHIVLPPFAVSCMYIYILTWCCGHA